MQYPPQLALDRIALLLDELKASFWLDRQPLQASVYQCSEPCTYEQARRQAFTPVEAGFRWGPVWSTAWFHLEGHYPAAWTGSTVTALIDTGSEALVWSDAGPVQGLDSNRKDLPLAVHANDAGTVDLFVEAAANPGWRQEYSTEPAPFTFAGAWVARFNPLAWELYYDLQVLYDLATHLPEDSGQRAQLITAMSTALHTFRRGGENAYAAARASLDTEYAKPAIASFARVHAIGQSHIDTAWLWPIRETIRKCARTFSTALSYMERYPEYLYLQSQPQLYAYMKAHYPSLYARIKAAVAAGRWEPEGAMWVEADCNIPSGEALVRQILHGTRFFREEFGVENYVLWLPDVFGFSGALPQIMRGCGLPYFLTTKMTWNQFNTFPYHSFWWEGIDGTRVLAHQTPMFGSGEAQQAGWLLKGERLQQSKAPAPTWLYPFGIGDGGGGVTKGMLEVVRRVRDLEGMPPTSMGKVSEWFPLLEASAAHLPVWVGELYLERHRGTLTTQAQVKAENRRGEILLHDAEVLAVLSPGTLPYPATALDEAWKKLLLNQFHDILPGSSIHMVYEDSARDYQQIHATTEGIIAERLDAFGASLDTRYCTHPALLWNTLGFARTALVRLPWTAAIPPVAVGAHGEPLRTQRCADLGEPAVLVEVEAPSLGYTLIDLREGETSDLPGDVVTASQTALENGLLRAVFNPAGELIALTDKALDREILPPGAVGNRFQRFDERGLADDAWEIVPLYDAEAEELTSPGSLTVVEAGPLRATLCVQRALTPRAQLRQYIRLEAGSRRLDFETHIDWQEDGALLKVAFPVAIHAPNAAFEIQFGYLERPTHRSTSWDAARYEVAAHKWADLSEANYGVALLNDSKYGYDVLGNVLRLSLLRATTHPDPWADRGMHHFTYSLYCHPAGLGTGDVVRAGYALNVPLHILPLTLHPGALPPTHSYLSVNTPTVIIDTLKRAEDGDGLIVRLYESCRDRGCARLRAGFPVQQAARTDMLERMQEIIAVSDGVMKVNYRPFEIVTLRLLQHE